MSRPLEITVISRRPGKTPEFMTVSKWFVVLKPPEIKFETYFKKGF